MRFHTSSLLCWAICLGLICSPVTVWAAQEITLLSPRSLSSVDGLDLGNPIETAESEEVKFSLSEAQIRVVQTLGGWSTVLIEGCALSSRRPGAPQLPMKTIRRTLPRGATVESVSVVSGTIASIDERLRLSPAPEPAFWSSDGLPTRPRENASIYRSSSPFPRELVRYCVGADKQQTVLTVQFYPLVFYPDENRVCLITEAVIRIDYSLDSQSDSSVKGLGGSRCVIISPDCMSFAADEIALVHEEDGIETDVITVESIFFSYDEADDPPYDGYPYGSPVIPISYNYSLAKKIISYLRDTDAHPSLEYVTILGDGGNVPASYYYHDADSGLGGREDWIPTDFFYSSPDYDLVPNYKVGRLPANDVSEAGLVALKIRTWRNGLDRLWFDNVMVAGSRPFHTPYYYGELMSVDMLNQGYFDGMNVTKAFGTDDRYTVNVVSESLRNGGYGFLYDSGHGYGSGIMVDNGTISSTDLFRYGPSESQLPVVVSIACICGQFDSSGYIRSFGEGIVLSQAGGIAYFGGTRINAGIASQAFDNGNLIVTKQEHMGGMTKNVFASYAAGETDLGGLYTGAVTRFLSENDWEDFLVRRTLFEFVLLGDPALQIPSFQGGAPNEVPVFEPANPDFMNNQSLPSYTNSGQKTVRAGIDSDSSILSCKLVNATDVQVVGRSLAFGPTFDYSFEPVVGFKIYIVRAEAEDGKEGWFVVNTASSLICIDGDLTDWCNEALRPIAVDPTLDFDDAEYDVSTLYAYSDNDYWHFAFAATCKQDDMSYVLAIDYQDGGYAGVEGQSTDARDNYVTFDPAFAVDAEIYLRHITWVPWLGWEAFRYCKLYQHYGEGGWSELGLESIGATLSYSPVGDLVELAVPKAYLGDASEINVILFSLSSGESSPAQDSVPSDPATFESLTLGREHANTLSQFARPSCKPVNCILGAGYFGSEVSASAGGELRIAALLSPSATPPVSMELYLDEMPSGLFLNDEGISGDTVAGDRLWTFSADVGPGALTAGEYLVSIVASDEMGGCAGQWPPLLFSSCDRLMEPNAIPAPQMGWMFETASPEEPVSHGDVDNACTILAAGVFNTATAPADCTIEAFAYVGACDVDTIEVRYAGFPLGAELGDDGRGNDAVAGDGIFSGAFNIDSDSLMHRSYILELVPTNDGEHGLEWPYLHVED